MQLQNTNKNCSSGISKVFHKSIVKNGVCVFRILSEGSLTKCVAFIIILVFLLVFLCMLVYSLNNVLNGKYFICRLEIKIGTITDKLGHRIKKELIEKSLDFSQTKMTLKGINKCYLFIFLIHSEFLHLLLIHSLTWVYTYNMHPAPSLLYSTADVTNVSRSVSASFPFYLLGNPFNLFCLSCFSIFSLLESVFSSIRVHMNLFPLYFNWLDTKYCSPYSSVMITTNNSLK